MGRRAVRTSRVAGSGPGPSAASIPWSGSDRGRYKEAGSRIKAEITETETRLAAFGDSDQAERELVESRRRALREAAEELAPS